MVGASSVSHSRDSPILPFNFLPSAAPPQTRCHAHPATESQTPEPLEEAPHVHAGLHVRKSRDARLPPHRARVPLVARGSPARIRAARRGTKGTVGAPRGLARPASAFRRGALRTGDA